MTKILKIPFLKRPRMAQFYYFFVMIIFTMVEENVKMLKIAYVKRPRMAQFYHFCVLIIFSMVEENFEIAQNGSILLYLCRDYFHHG